MHFPWMDYFSYFNWYKLIQIVLLQNALAIATAWPWCQIVVIIWYIYMIYLLQYHWYIDCSLFLTSTWYTACFCLILNAIFWTNSNHLRCRYKVQILVPKVQLKNVWERPRLHDTLLQLIRLFVLFIRGSIISQNIICNHTFCSFISMIVFHYRPRTIHQPNKHAVYTSGEIRYSDIHGKILIRDHGRKTCHGLDYISRDIVTHKSYMVM